MGPRSTPPPDVEVIYGVMIVMIYKMLVGDCKGKVGARTQFHSQFEAVDSATPRDRIGRGKTSPITTQAPGPQVVAKKKI